MNLFYITILRINIYLYGIIEDFMIWLQQMSLYMNLIFLVSISVKLRSHNTGASWQYFFQNLRLISKMFSPSVHY